MARYVTHPSHDETRHRQRIVIRITVGHITARADQHVTADRRVLRRGTDVVTGQRRRTHHRHRHRGRLRYTTAGHHVGVAVGTEEARVRRVGDRVVRVNRQRAVGRRRRAGHHGRPLEAVVRQHRDGHRHARPGGRGVIGDVRHRGHDDGQCCNGRAVAGPPSVVNRVGDIRHRAVPVSHWREGVSACFIELQHPLARDAHV